jgi:hypothetical protein
VAGVGLSKASGPGAIVDRRQLSPDGYFARFLFTATARSADLDGAADTVLTSFITFTQPAVVCYGSER